MTIEKDVLIRERQKSIDRDIKIEELEKAVKAEKEESQECRRQMEKLAVLVGERENNISELNRELDQL